ncbi:bromodomain and WD repeat-containing protein 3 isoform X1 [Pieris napi]|uniref:bromodomain and WD repeat-containing protein 3 isoform X1 n=1 Tax=Pieris napi TaxID=78633 RepID=UPI001FB8D61C|nr:bromodomain and WD repeat-containing protein 3 isoform X1 [Pieris napi]
MEESNEDLNVVPELYFLIAKFLSGGPLKETAKTLLKELQSVEVLPRRLDWEGKEHPLSYDELNSQYSEVSWRRLAAVCERALRLARAAPQISLIDGTEKHLNARLSLLSESLVRPKFKYASFKQDHSLVRRLICREVGGGPKGPANGAGVGASTGQQGPFPARLLRNLQLQRRTLGHLSAVYCLVFDCTGKYIITGADDLLVKVWSAIDGRLLATLRGAFAEITDVCISSDGALLACGSVERLVRVWCMVTGAPRAVLHAHAGTITSVHWAPPAHSDVRWLASTSTDGSVAFWTCSTDGQFLSQPVQYVERMRPGVCHMICAAWSAGGAFLAAGSADHHVRIYSVAVGGPRRVLETAVHLDAVDSIAWAHCGLRFVSGSKDGTAALWTLYATQWRHSLLKTCAGDDQKKLKVTMVCWDCSDEYVMTAVSDNTVRVWCSRTCTQVRVLSGHRDEAYVLEAHPFLPGILLSAGHDGQLFVWDAANGEVLAQFHNVIEGQGEGAIFDAKWGEGNTIAASDSHGHVLLLGLGQGHRLLGQLPPELFFHTDYRPLVRDALGGALDEQTEIPPHLMPPPFLVDVEGAPHPPEFQRLVPGRENLALSQLIPHADAARSRLDAMIEALAADPATPPAQAPQAAGVWRGEGVRHTAGSWQPLDVPLSTRPILLPLPPAQRQLLEKASVELNNLEMSWYRREMRRRPVMISIPGADSGPRRKPGRRPRAPAPRARPQPPQPNTEVREDACEEEATDSSNSTSDSSVSLSSHSSRSEGPRPRTRPRPRPRARVARNSSHSNSYTDLSDLSPVKSDSSSESSQYSDWEAGTALAPPARARRKPVPSTRYSPSTVTSKRSAPATSAAPVAAAPSAAPSAASAAAPAHAGVELPEAYRVGEWLTAVSPRKAPYHPQMGDRCVYFRLGHQRYFEAVSEKDLYKVNARDKPWERMHINDCEAVKVVGMKYVIKPPRVVCLKLAREVEKGSFTVRYHDMPDVIDFLVLQHQYEAAVARNWGEGDRFRCMIDDSWWTGIVLERISSVGGLPGSNPLPQTSATNEWAAAAASHFLSLRVRWDNGEVERLSPWDLEPLDPERLPAEPGGAVAVLPHELEAVLCRNETHEWPPDACEAIAAHISQVMSLSAAEPFVAPVDLQLYPSYALVVPYPIDLATIRARFDNQFYRRAAAAQFDGRYLASNAEQFNKSHSPIVRQARLVTDLLLSIISTWQNIDVVSKYHELAASYHSSDEEPLQVQKNRREERARSEGAWRQHCLGLLRELSASADAEPFRQPVSPSMAPALPDYNSVIARPMDLGSVQQKLESNGYSNADEVAADVRLVFTNSRLYNTNKRSRIYSMTVRLSSLFEALWTRMPVETRSTRRSTRHRRVRHSRPTRRAVEETNGSVKAKLPSSSSECETLAVTSRRTTDPRHDDSWDSDAPLNAHSKGKGVGKKTKNGAIASTSSRVPPMFVETNGVDQSESEEEMPARQSIADGSTSDSSAYSRIQVVEEELVEDEVEVTYEEEESNARSERRRHRNRNHLQSNSRKRRRSKSSEDSEGSRPRDSRPGKRTRERFTDGSSSSSSSGSNSGWCSGGAARYESDRSYKPDRPQQYSSDDETPLLLYRQRQGDEVEAGPSRRPHHRKGVSLRKRRSPRRYNEDSEEDSIAAISKRLPHHQDHQRHQRLFARRRQNHAQGTGVPGASAAPHNEDHNYFNGHSHHHNRDSPAGSGGSSGPGPVSISSRGRVRRLTAKARGLLRE